MCGLLFRHNSLTATTCWGGYGCWQCTTVCWWWLCSYYHVLTGYASCAPPVGMPNTNILVMNPHIFIDEFPPTCITYTGHVRLDRITSANRWSSCSKTKDVCTPLTAALNFWLHNNSNYSYWLYASVSQSWYNTYSFGRLFICIDMRESGTKQEKRRRRRKKLVSPLVLIFFYRLQSIRILLGGGLKMSFCCAPRTLALHSPRQSVLSTIVPHIQPAISLQLKPLCRLRGAGQVLTVSLHYCLLCLSLWYWVI